MEVHPIGSSISSQEIVSPGESCGVGWFCELDLFYDLTNLVSLRSIQFRDFKKATLNSLKFIETLHQGGVPLILIPGLD